MQDELKVLTYTWLRNDKPGANYIHFSRAIDYPPYYFKGICIEELKTRRQGGDDIDFWEKPAGQLNEPLDTFNYACVAFLARRVNLVKRDKVLNG